MSTMTELAARGVTKMRLLGWNEHAFAHPAAPGATPPSAAPGRAPGATQ